MATPSVLTVPSMYGDGILYSGPSTYGSELVTNGDFSDGLNGWTLSTSPPTLNPDNTVTFDDSNEFIFRTWTDVVGTKYRIVFEGVGSIRYRTGFAGSDGTIVPINLPCEVDLLATADTNRIQIYGSLSQGNGILKSVSIKEITQGSDFNFTRSTTGTRINEDGYIEDVPYNLIKDSEDFDGDWGLQTMTVEVNKTISPKNTFKGGLITTGGTTPCLIRPNSLSLQVGQTYTFSVFVKKENISSIRWIRLAHVSSAQTGAWFDLDNIAVGTVNSESATIVDAGNGWYRIANTFVAYQNSTFNSVFIAPSEGNGLTDAGPATLSAFIWGAQVVKGDKTKDYLPTTDILNLPRLNYPPYGGCPSILAEPQRINLVINSNNAEAVPGNFVSNIQINSSNNLSPEGINNAQEIEVTATGQPRVESVVTSNTTVYSVSAYVKKVTGDFFGLGFYQQDIGNQFAKFDLNTGTFVAVSSNGAVSQSATNIYNCEIIAYKNNWYRITCTILTGSAASKSNMKWLAMSSGTSSSSFSNGVVGEKFLIYGRQVEQASYVTSLIHTKGSTVTRNEDKAFHAGLGTTDTFNDSEGVLFIETKALQDQVAQARGVSINAGNGNNRVLISYPSSATSAILGYTQSTAGSGSSISFVGIDITQKHKAAIKYELNNTSFWVDGVRIGVDTSVAMPVGLKQLDLTNGISTNTAEYRGNLNAIAVYKTALTDTELANLTSYNNHDLFIPYRSRMQMIGADQELQCTEHDITRFL